MQIELPDDAYERAKQIAIGDENAQTVILKAIERLAIERKEVAAVMEGIAEYEKGEYRAIEEFGNELSQRFGIDLPGS